jgi:formylglycine-generating enzyme required for sulfatase activity
MSLPKLNKLLFPLSLTGIAATAFLASTALLGPSESSASPTTAASSLLCDSYKGLPDGTSVHAGMVRVLGGRFIMGSDDHYPEESLAHEVVMEGFWIDRHDVTNAQFARFVAATGYLTDAERVESRSDHPVASAVFFMPTGNRAGTWRLVPGANWRHPRGPDSDLEGLDNHPVVQISYQDAQAYARWLGRELPTEAQWEFAARGGLAHQPYVWGDRFTPEGRAMANTWQGPFPIANTGEDGYVGTSPVGCFPANGYGLYDMAGNVWQWTTTWYAAGHTSRIEFNPTGPEVGLALNPTRSQEPAKVIKGGSHLCAANLCMRYRPSARQPAEPSLGTTHIGFRTVARASDAITLR